MSLSFCVCMEFIPLVVVLLRIIDNVRVITGHSAQHYFSCSSSTRCFLMTIKWCVACVCVCLGCARSDRQYLCELCGIILTFIPPRACSEGFAVVCVFDLFQWHTDAPLKRSFTGIRVRKNMQVCRPLLCVIYLRFVFACSLLYCGKSECFCFLCCFMPTKTLCTPWEMA